MIDYDRRLLFIKYRSVKRDQTARPRVDDVVGKNIVCHVPLHLKLARSCCRRIIVVQRVVDNDAVFCVSPLGCITADRNTSGVAVIDKVIPCGDVTRGAVSVLAGQLDSKIHIVNHVLFDQGSGTAIDVNSVGIFFIAISRIAFRGDVVNQIAADQSVARLVHSRIRRRALETDDVDSNVVVVVDQVMGNAEVRDVSVYDE